MIDVKIFDNNKEEPITVYINDDIDFTSLKILYENCIRVGSDENLNITIATIHPSLWFGEIFEYIQKTVKIVTKLPSFRLIKIENNQLVYFDRLVKTLNFNSDAELKTFFEEDCKYKSLAMFSICKYLDVTNLSVIWRVKCVDITTKEEIRDKKLDSIIN